MTETSAMMVDLQAEGHSIAEVAQLIDNMKHTDLELRLAAVRELAVIARALGPARTRMELLPFVKGKCAVVTLLGMGTCALCRLCRGRRSGTRRTAHDLRTATTRSQTRAFSRADSIDDEEDVLVVVAEQLADFVPLVGGPEHAHSLLPTLEVLVAVRWRPQTCGLPPRWFAVSLSP